MSITKCHSTLSSLVVIECSNGGLVYPQQLWEANTYTHTHVNKSLCLLATHIIKAGMRGSEMRSNNHLEVSLKRLRFDRKCIIPGTSRTPFRARRRLFRLTSNWWARTMTYYIPRCRISVKSQGHDFNPARSRRNPYQGPERRLRSAPGRSRGSKKWGVIANLAGRAR